jgi:hypothetical protein
MERNRLYSRDHPHLESPASRKRSNRKYRISSYGLTQEQFDPLLRLSPQLRRNAAGGHRRSRGHKGTLTTETVYRKVIVPELCRGAEVMDRLFN